MMACRSVATSWRSNRLPRPTLRRDESGGKLPVGRVLEPVYKRLEQEDHEEMRKQIRLGGAFVDPRRPFEADQAFKPFERRFNAPSETIKGEDIGGREDLGRQRGYENDPFGSEERAFRDLMSAFYSFPPSL